VHRVLATEHRAFHKGPTIQAAKMLLGESLLTSEGDAHRSRRRLIQPMFHHARIAAYAEPMVRRAEDAAAGWREGAELDLHAEMGALTLGIVGETLFGTDVDGERSATVRLALTDTLAMFERVYSPVFRLVARVPTPAMRRYRRLEAELDRVIGELVAERRAKGATGEDVLSRLLRAGDDGEAMPDEQVRDEALTLFLAGHETTANALAWTWWLLSGHPEVETRLHAELDRTLGGRSPSGADLRRLGYAEAVLSESIRLRPPAWAIGRRAVRDVRIGDVDVRCGSIVVVSPWLLHHDARWWPDPEDFRPERWTGAAPDRPRGAFVPFGGGPRVCVGEPFAWMEGVLLLSAIAQRWRFRLVPGHVVVPQPVITLRPRGGLPMVAERRERRVA
jgi:cytochrome P450